MTIATVVFNARLDLLRTLDSVSRQKTDGIEYLVIDGASTDGTREAAMAAGGLVDGLTSEPDRGIYDAMNKAVAKARGKAIHFLNAGDTLAEGSLRWLLDAALSPADLTCHAVLVHDDDDHDGAKGGIEHPPRHYPAQRPPARPDPQHMYWPHPGVVAKRNLFDRVGVFDAGLRCAADLDWANRVMRTPNLRIDYSERAVVLFALGGASSTRASARETRDVALRFGKPRWQANVRYWKVLARQWAAARTPAPNR